MAKQQIAACVLCGSDDVTHDAVVRWSIPDQRWEVSGVFDNADCGACGADGDNIVEFVELESESADDQN